VIVFCSLKWHEHLARDSHGRDAYATFQLTHYFRPQTLTAVAGANIVWLFGNKAAHHRDRRTVRLWQIDAGPDVGA
jgi:hypothetical protein